MSVEAANAVDLVDRRVDLVRQVVVLGDGTTVSLTTREAELLAYLAARPDDDVSREELLDQVWSYRASYATRAVDVTMRRLRAKIEPDPQTPVHLISVHGVGYRFVPSPSQPLAEASAEAPTSRAHADSGERSSFVGRADELAQLAALVGQQHRLISVLGPGGVGKSRLTRRFVQGVRQDGGEARSVWWCELEAVDTQGGLVAAVATALGAVLTGHEGDLVDTLGKVLAGRGPSLLVLDAFEHAVELAAATIGVWLEAAPDAVFVVTSRERLHLVGEQVLDVSPLPLPDAKQLLVDRLSAAGIDPATVDDDAVTRIVERVDRLPLAIELAAPRARMMPLDELFTRLQERFDVLGAVPRADGRTMQAVLDGSWDLLEDDEQRALAWCSVFVGGFTLEAAEAVLDVGGDTWPLDRIEALRDKSLVRVMDQPADGDVPRLGLYESVREYAAERLVERREVELVEGRHAAFVVALGEELAQGIERHGGRQRMVQLAAEADNLLAVVRRRLASHPLDAARAAASLEPLFVARGPAAVYARLLDEVLAVAGEPPDPRVAALWVARANMHRMSGRIDDGVRATERALDLVRGGGSATEARCYAVLALLRFESSRIDEAVGAATDGLGLARAGGHRVLEGVFVGMLGAFAAIRGSVDEAERRYVDAIRIDREVGNEPRAALDLANYGLMLTEIGRLEEADDHMSDALELHLGWNNTRGAAGAHGSLATLRARQGDLAEAHHHAVEAERLYRGAGYARFAAMSAQNCALLRWARTRPVDALGDLRAVVGQFVALADPAMEAMARTYLAAALAASADASGAAAELDAVDALVAAHPTAAERVAGLAMVARGFEALARWRAGDASAEATFRAARDAGSASTQFGVAFLAGLLGAAPRPDRP